jgi:hypothetical protein
MAVPIFQLEDIKPTYQDAIDSVYIVLGKPCLIVCDGAKSECPNCYFDPSAGRSSGIYNGTGPAPFSNGLCPVCKGSGYDPATEEIRVEKSFSIQRTVKPSQLPIGLQFTKPATVVRIKGFVADLPPLLAMRYVLLDYKNETAMKERYVKLSDPEYSGNIVSGRYFKMFLQRSN